MRYSARLLAMLFAVSAPLSFRAEAQSYTLFIGPCENCTSGSAEIRAFDDAVEKQVKSKLPIADRLANATYVLQNVNLADEGNAALLRLHVTFHAPRGELHITGTSKVSSDLSYRMATALDDLLGRTLFDPDRGPYVQLTVTDCQVTPGLPDQFDLQVNSPSSGIGIETTLFYEIALAKDGRLNGTAVYVYFNEPGSSQGQSLPAKVWSSDGARRPNRCPHGPFLLLRHSMLPQVSQGRRYENFRQP
jgi:hypothetical protein